MKINSIWRIYADKFNMADMSRKIQNGGYMKENSIWRLYTDKFNMADI